MKLTESTFIPLSLAWAAVASVIGSVMWLTTIFVQGNANAKEIEGLKSEMKVLHEIRERVIRIEEKVERVRGK